MLLKYRYLYPFIFSSLFASCQETNPQHKVFNETNSTEVAKTLVVASIDSTLLNYAWHAEYKIEQALCNKIQPPEGYERIPVSKESYANWLRHLPLSNDPKVYYFDGTEKFGQESQHAVIDIDVGTKDLQQCADAVMRLRAEYLYANEEYDDIHFKYTNGTNIPFTKWSGGYYPSVKGNKVYWTASSKNNKTYTSFRKYMTSIYMYAGTASLEKELEEVPIDSIQAGDVFIQGGHPGHAIIVVDVCVNKETNEKCFMVAQSFMPAQSIHVLKNLRNEEFSPWYRLSESQQEVLTPEWSFYSSDLMRFSK